MSVTRVSITEMPGPGVWEFLMQWGGMFTQAAAALGTLWAVVVALRVAGAQAQWRHEDLSRERAIVSAVVRSELGTLKQPLEMLIYQFAGGKCLSSLDRVPANPQAIAATCRAALDTPRTWDLIDKVGYLLRAREIAAVLAHLPIVIKGCQTIEAKAKSGLVVEPKDVWIVGSAAHVLEWHRRRALDLDIDEEEFPYTLKGE